MKQTTWLNGKTVAFSIAMLLAGGAGLVAADGASGLPERRYLPETARNCGVTDLDVTKYDLVGVSETGLPPPDLPPGMKVLTFTLDVWKCIHPEENVAADDPAHSGLPGVVAPPPAEAESVLLGGAEASWGPSGSPYAGNNGGSAQYTILLPNTGDPLYPAGGCNWDATVEGLNDLRANAMQGGFSTYCYYLPLWNTGGNTDIHGLRTQFDNVVNNNYGSLVDKSWKLVIGIVKRANHIGIGAIPGQSSIVAEVRTDGWDAPHHSVVEHEVGHNWGATHYPSETWKWVCQTTSSVMNYCSMQAGARVFDTTNKNTIINRYWRTS